MAVLLDRLVELDRTALLWVTSTLRHPGLDQSMLLITDKWTFAAPAVLFSAYLWRTDARRARIFLLSAVLTVALGDLAGSLLKDAVARPRPCLALPRVQALLGCGPSFSFPSNHALNSSAVATVVAVLYPRWFLPAAVIAALVSYSRVHLGVHYPADVVAGAVLGIAIGAGFASAGKLWLRRSPPCASP